MRVRVRVRVRERERERETGRQRDKETKSISSERIREECTLLLGHSRANGVRSRNLTIG